MPAQAALTEGGQLLSQREAGGSQSSNDAVLLAETLFITLVCISGPRGLPGIAGD
jgi:hypothetical protein